MIKELGMRKGGRERKKRGDRRLRDAGKARRNIELGNHPLVENRARNSSFFSASFLYSTFAFPPTAIHCISRRTNCV
jgi:hypothetical protein